MFNNQDTFRHLAPFSGDLQMFNSLKFWKKEKKLRNKEKGQQKMKEGN